MARYIGPKCRLSRREGVDLHLKSGVRSLESKCKVNVPPGQFGDHSVRVTDYSLQLRMKQLIKRYYGVLERQFGNYYREADRQQGSSGENLLRILESRLDNIVYRLGFASTRAEARQLVNHRSILVNGKIVNIASYLLKPQDVISVRDKSKNQLRVSSSLKIASQNGVVDWLSLDADNMKGVYLRYPNQDEYPVEFKVHLVIELYSK